MTHRPGQHIPPEETWHGFDPSELDERKAGEIPDGDGNAILIWPPEPTWPPGGRGMDFVQTGPDQAGFAPD